MIRPRYLTTATAGTLIALLMTGTASPAVTAVACICPDSPGEVEAATVCTCCDPMSSYDRVVEAESALEQPSCSDCVAVPLRAPPVKNDHFQLDTVTVNVKRHSVPTVRVIDSERGLLFRPDQGHRLTLALLSSVILLI